MCVSLQTIYATCSLTQASLAYEVPIEKSLETGASNLHIVEEHQLWPGLGQVNCKPGQLVQTSQGTILACWYGGREISEPKTTHEDTLLWLSRYSQGVWSHPECVYREQGFHIWNPVFLKMLDGRLALFFRKFKPVVEDSQQKGTGVRQFVYQVMFSNDDGRSWTGLKSLPENITGPSKCSPLVLSDGSWIIPSSKDNMCYLELSVNEGDSWKEVVTLHEGKGSFAQPAIMQADDGKVHVIYSWWPKEKVEKNIKHVVLDLKNL